MKQIGMFVLVAILLVTIMSVSFAQGEQPKGTGMDVTPAAESASPKTGNIGDYQPTTQAHAAPQAREAPQPTATGEKGETGAPGRDGKSFVYRTRVETRTVAGHQGHKHPYQHIKSWNPASRSYVDAKITQAKLGSNETAHRDWSWLWWLLAIIGLLGLIWALINGFGYLWQRFVGWLRQVIGSSEKPEAKPEPDMTNTDSGDYFGYDAGPAKIALYCDGTTVIKKWKGYADCAKGDGSFKWAGSDETVEAKFAVGAKVAFALSRENIGNVPVPTEGVTIRDDFNAKTFGRYILGSGRLVVSGKKVADLEDEFIQRIIGGASVPLDEVIDMIPAKSSVSIVYFVNCIPSIGHGTGPEGSPTPDDELKRQGRFKLTEIEAAQADAEAEAVGTEQTGPARYVPASQDDVEQARRLLAQ